MTKFRRTLFVSACLVILLGTVAAARAGETLNVLAFGNSLSHGMLDYLPQFAAADGVEVVDRMKVLRLIENLVAGAGSVAYLIESMHGAGPPMAQRIMIGRQADVDAKMGLVKRILDIP